jgi:hypothetical protein
MTKLLPCHHDNASETLVVNRTLAIVAFKPTSNTVQMETAEAFESGHIDTNFELFQTNRAFRFIDTVLLSGLVREKSG